MDEMERAYRRRLERTRWALFAAAFVLLSIVHFTFGPLWIPLLGVAVGCALLGAWGERLLFPLAWRTFDASRPSPALEGEAQALSRRMGVRLDGLRTSRGSRFRAEWKGRTAVVPPWFRDLPDDERHYALARTLASAPGTVARFLAWAGWPLFFAWFGAWQFDSPDMMWALGAALFPPLVLRIVHEPARHRKERDLAREIAGPDAERSFLAQQAAQGSSGAAWELKRLIRA